MKENTLPKTLVHYLKTYCNVNAPLIDDLRKIIQNKKSSERFEEFRCQLADAIVLKNISTSQYESLTDEGFDTQDDLIIWLRELWDEIFDNDPIPGDT